MREQPDRFTAAVRKVIRPPGFNAQNRSSAARADPRRHCRTRWRPSALRGRAADGAAAQL